MENLAKRFKDDDFLILNFDLQNTKVVSVHRSPLRLYGKTLPRTTCQVIPLLHLVEKNENLQI
ncbi:MAG: hypothetical protein BGO78_14710 [Chloroflexi bacterium 44-23]|nr:MAG: hypothetical protein BGO78_14710 [Chloroflexi bacterium 44-23]